LKYNICDLIEKKCVRKNIYPLEFQELIGFIFIFFGSALSNAGGIGGGGLLIPVMLLIFKFYTHEAIPMTKLMIFTGALTSFILGFKQAHPYRKSITIDYNIPYLIIPLLLFGSMIGVSLNKVLPSWIILISLTLVLVINTKKTLEKAANLRKKENEILQSEKSIDIVEMKDHISIEKNKEFSKNKSNLKTNKIKNTNLKLDPFKLSDISGEISQADKQIYLMKEEKKDLRKFPFEKISLMFICYLFMLIITFLKGSEHYKSIINITRFI